MDAWDLSATLSHNFEDAQAQLQKEGRIPADAPPDARPYCLEFWAVKSLKDVSGEILDESAVIFNELIAAGFTALSAFARAHTQISLQSTQFSLIFVMEFINMALIELYSGFDQWHITDYLLGGAIAE